MATERDKENRPLALQPHSEADVRTLLEELLAKPREADYNRGLEPRDDEAAWRLCERVAKAKICGVKEPEDAYARVLFGRSIGLPAMAAIDGIRMFWSKQQETNVPCAFVKVKLGLCHSRPDVIEYIRPKVLQDGSVAISATRAICVGKRVGQPEVEYEFTIEDAETAGLVDRGKTAQGREANNYNKHPKAMLWWRACGRVIDIIAADLLLGLSSREDVEEQNEANVEKQPPPPPAVPAKDWVFEADKLKDELREALEKKDRKALTSLRARFQIFSDEAPPEIALDVKAYYNLVASTKTGQAAAAAANPAAGTAAAPTAAPTAPLPPAAAQAALPGTSAPPAATKSAYLPPNQRGDSYDGPEHPEPPFK